MQDYSWTGLNLGCLIQADSYIPISLLYFQFKDDVAKRTDLATPHCDFISLPSWGLWSLCLCQQASQ